MSTQFLEPQQVPGLGQAVADAAEAKAAATEAVSQVADAVEKADKAIALTEGYDEKIDHAVETAESVKDDASEAKDAALEAVEKADNMQKEIDALNAASDVKDVVRNYAELQDYDKSSLTDNDIIKVLQDENVEDTTTYYRYNKGSNVFDLIGSVGPYYTKAEADEMVKGELGETPLWIVGSTGSEHSPDTLARGALTFSSTEPDKLWYHMLFLNRQTGETAYYTNSSWTVPLATHDRAGAMSGTDKANLDKLVEGGGGGGDATSGVVAVVDNYEALQEYSIEGLEDDVLITVLRDETHDNATTYYRFTKEGLPPKVIGWDCEGNLWPELLAQGCRIDTIEEGQVMQYTGHDIVFHGNVITMTPIYTQYPSYGGLSFWMNGSTLSGYQIVVTPLETLTDPKEHKMQTGWTYNDRGQFINSTSLVWPTSSDIAPAESDQDRIFQTGTYAFAILPLGAEVPEGEFIYAEPEHWVYAGSVSEGDAGADNIVKMGYNVKAPIVVEINPADISTTHFELIEYNYLFQEWGKNNLLSYLEPGKKYVMEYIVPVKLNLSDLQVINFRLSLSVSECGGASRKWSMAQPQYKNDVNYSDAYIEMSGSTVIQPTNGGMEGPSILVTAESMDKPGGLVNNPTVKFVDGDLNRPRFAFYEIVE